MDVRSRSNHDVGSGRKRRSASSLNSSRVDGRNNWRPDKIGIANLKEYSLNRGYAVGAIKVFIIVDAQKIVEVYFVSSFVLIVCEIQFVGHLVCQE